MQQKNYQAERERKERDIEIYRLRIIEGKSVPELMAEFGLCKAQIWKILSNFERENPQMAEMMRRQGKDVTPADYRELQEEITRLKKALERERLRADFYEEMVAYGEEVYGIKLKKDGTK